MSEFYILDADKTPVRVSDPIEWALMLERTKERIVRQQWVYGFGRQQVSTVFLGLNHRFGPGPPLIFETMIFGGPADQYQDRYSTWHDAEIGHWLAVEEARNHRWDLGWLRFYYSRIAREFRMFRVLQDFQGRMPLELSMAYLHFRCTPKDFDLQARMRLWERRNSAAGNEGETAW